MVTALTINLRKKHGFWSMHVRKDEKFSIFKGLLKGKKGKITKVYWLRWYIYS